MRHPKKPKPTHLPADTALSGDGLLAAQRTNLLITIVADAGYPEAVLTSEQFIIFREATMRILDKEPASKWMRFESCFRGGGS